MAKPGSSSPKPKAGRTVAADGKAQHNDLYRKLLLRRDLLASASEGAFYVPFIGDGDIAVELYPDRAIYGADLDPERVATAAKRLPDAEVRVFDCDAWPFTDVDATFAVADLDSYAHPYVPLESFLAGAKLADRLVIFGTDGMRQAIKRTGTLPALPKCKGPKGNLLDRRKVYNGWWPKHILPYLERTLAPRTITRSVKYQTTDMVYWGIVADLADLGPAAAAGNDQLAAVESALFGAAKTGNIPAITLWLQRHPPAPNAQPSKEGRPTKRTPATRTVILEALTAGNTRTAACKVAGIGLDTLSAWGKSDAEFLGALEKAEAEAELSHLANIVAADKRGVWTADAWWLERRRHADYGRRDIYRDNDPGSMSDVDAFLLAETAPPPPDAPE